MAECPSFPGERWLAAVGFEGLYEVSDLGRVWSVPRPCNRRRVTAGGQLLTGAVNTGGYHFVQLYRGGKRYTRLIHMLVLQAFTGPCPPGLISLHGPGGQADNSLANLSYGTASQNRLDMRRDGTGNFGKTLQQWHKLNLTLADEMRARYASGDIGIRPLAREYGVSPMTAWKALKNQTWRHAE